MSSARYAIERMRSSMRPYTALAPRRRLRVGEEQVLPRFRLVLDALDRGYEVGEAADPGWGDLVAEIGVADHVGEILDRDLLVADHRDEHLRRLAGTLADDLVGVLQRGKDRGAELGIRLMELYRPDQQLV